VVNATPQLQNNPSVYNHLETLIFRGHDESTILLYDSDAADFSATQPKGLRR
jgi:hypothetical protein